MNRRRVGFMMVCLLVLGVMLSSTGALYAQKPVDEAKQTPDQVASPDQVIIPNGSGLQAYSITGSDFLPRLSNAITEYTANGCIRHVDQNSIIPQYTVGVHIPVGSKVIGLTYKYRGTSNAANTNSLSFVHYNMSTATNLFTHYAVNSGVLGFQKVYSALSTPHIISGMGNSAYILAWTPSRTSANDELCGATLWYEPPADPNPNVFWTSTGDVFTPLRSSMNKSSTNSCIYSLSNPAAMVLDVDLPNGTRINGFRMYYNDTNLAEFVETRIVLANHANNTVTELASVKSSSSSGMGGDYVSLSTPYVVNTATDSIYAYAVVGGDSTRQLCGISVDIFYPSMPIPQVVSPVSDQAHMPNEQELAQHGIKTQDIIVDPSAVNNATTQYKYVTGMTFHTPDSTTVKSTVTSSIGPWCVYVNGTTGKGFLDKSVVLPKHAKITQLKLYYVSNSLSSSVVTAVLFNDGSASGIAPMTALSVANTGYSVVSSTDPAFTYSPDVRSLTLRWDPNVKDSTLQLCGVRIQYDLGYKTFIPLVMK